MSSGRTSDPMPDRSCRCSTLFHQRSPWFFTIAGSSRKMRVAGPRRSSSVRLACSSARATGAKNSQPGKMVASIEIEGSVETQVSESRPGAPGSMATPLRVRRALMAARIFSVTGVSVSGSSSASSIVEAERCVSGSKRRMDSISSPKNSRRTGRSISGE